MSMGYNKPRLTIEEQIDHLKNKGVKFEIMRESEAKDYLENRNNFFKLTSYRKNYPKNPGGENKGKYYGLDFAYLVDLAIVDMRLRYAVIHLALDIEHHVKLEILRKISDNDEDGYSIIKDYEDSLGDYQKNRLQGEINRNEQSIYCGDIIRRYKDVYPVWVFIELVPFGRILDFYRFCADRFKDREMLDNSFRLKACKEIRNASAHNNCILNELKPSDNKKSTNKAVTEALKEIEEISSSFRKNKMSNERIKQLITLLYTHRTMVLSDGLKVTEGKEIINAVKRMHKNASYYDTNQRVKSTFNFIKIVVDNWYKD